MDARRRQTRMGSLWEAAQGSLVALPPSYLLLNALLSLNDSVLRINDNAALSLLMAAVFLTHSLAWRYAIRRLNEGGRFKAYILGMVKTAVKKWPRHSHSEP